MTGDKFEDFEGSFPFFMYDSFEMFEQLLQARETEMGGVGLECNLNSLIAAFSDTKIDYSKYESLVDELQHEESNVRKILQQKPFY